MKNRKYRSWMTGLHYWEEDQPRVAYQAPEMLKFVIELAIPLRDLAAMVTAIVLCLLTPKAAMSWAIAQLT